MQYLDTSSEDCNTIAAEAALIDAASMSRASASKRAKSKEEKLKKTRETRRRLDAILEARRLRDEFGYLGDQGDWPQQDEILL